MPRRRRSAALFALAGALTLPACGAAPAAAPIVALPAPPPPKPPGPDPARMHVLMINGGGNPNINYQPHLLHLRAMREMLLASGIHPDQIAVFSSDGADPSPDLVVRHPQSEPTFWMVEGTRLEHALEMRRTIVSSEIPDVQLQPATKEGLKSWFDAEAKVLKPGDTLFVYVTDHGNRTNPDPMTNTILLWGKNQQLSVTELRDLVHELAPGVRVVSLMSQCFSGAFAELSTAAATGPGPDVCGYFSSTADRPAYGCFAENVGKERVGHSFHFIRALAAGRHMEGAHDQVLSDDDTPDIPLRSSDAFLAETLAKTAASHAVSVEVLADANLAPGWRDQPALHDERALADRIAGAFGMTPPASLTELDAQSTKLVALERRFDAAARSLKGALSDATTDNLQGFLAANPTWNERVSDAALHALDTDGARWLTLALLNDLGAWTHKDKGDRLDQLEQRVRAADEAAYRTEVRLAVTLRLRVLLTSIAGRAYLETSGTKEQRDKYAALRACEGVTLPGDAPPATAGSEPTAPPTPFPPLADDEKLETDVHPGWIGISFSALGDDVRKQRKLPSGASVVTLVYPTSPAMDGGLEPGDVVLGPPGKPFTARNEIRAWSMFSPVGQPAPLEVLRGTKQVELAIVPRLLPTELPPLPQLAVGMPAPSLAVHSYRGGAVSLKDGQPHLLVFWETWCKPCKASLPEVLAYERKHHTQVVAITDEPKETIDAFFKAWKEPFPKTVVIDDYKITSGAYGLNATPKFVLVDGKGVVRSVSTGYARSDGLPIEGWKWDGK